MTCKSTTKAKRQPVYPKETTRSQQETCCLNTHKKTHNGQQLTTILQFDLMCAHLTLPFYDICENAQRSSSSFERTAKVIGPVCGCMVGKLATESRGYNNLLRIPCRLTQGQIQLYLWPVKKKEMWNKKFRSVKENQDYQTYLLIFRPKVLFQRLFNSLKDICFVVITQLFCGLKLDTATQTGPLNVSSSHILHFWLDYHKNGRIYSCYPTIYIMSKEKMVCLWC